MKIASYVVVAIALILASCSGKKEVTQVVDGFAAMDQVPAMNTPTRSIPKAVIYKTNTDCDNKVAVKTNAEGSQLVYYPDPTDISDASAPINVGDGWLLDRQGGIGEDTRFLKYSYEEYANLNRVPSQSELLEALIPNARVTEIEILPYTAAEAKADVNIVRQYIKNK